MIRRTALVAGRGAMQCRASARVRMSRSAQSQLRTSLDRLSVGLVVDDAMCRENVERHVRMGRRVVRGRIAHRAVGRIIAMNIKLRQSTRRSVPGGLTDPVSSSSRHPPRRSCVGHCRRNTVAGDGSRFVPSTGRRRLDVVRQSRLRQGASAVCRLLDGASDGGWSRRVAPRPVRRGSCTYTRSVARSGEDQTHLQVHEAPPMRRWRRKTVLARSHRPSYGFPEAKFLVAHGLVGCVRSMGKDWRSATATRRRCMRAVRRRVAVLYFAFPPRLAPPLSRPVVRRSGLCCRFALRPSKCCRPPETLVGAGRQSAIPLRRHRLRSIAQDACHRP